MYYMVLMHTYTIAVTKAQWQRSGRLSYVTEPCFRVKERGGMGGRKVEVVCDVR
jgi:hypothetical protein